MTHLKMAYDASQDAKTTQSTKWINLNYLKMHITHINIVYDASQDGL